MSSPTPFLAFRGSPGRSEWQSPVTPRRSCRKVPGSDGPKPKAAFFTPGRLCQFNVMPFGLYTEPATFEHMMVSSLRSLKWPTFLCSFDDAILISSMFPKHHHRFRRVLQCFRTAGVQLNSTKYSFTSREVEILGHVVHFEEILSLPDKTLAVKRFRKPTNFKDIHRFLGLRTYFRKFIAEFSCIVEPLKHLRENVPFRGKS